jgi:hypothetical protein
MILTMTEEQRLAEIGKVGLECVEMRIENELSQRQLRKEHKTGETRLSAYNPATRCVTLLEYWDARGEDIFKNRSHAGYVRIERRRD